MSCCTCIYKVMCDKRTLLGGGGGLGQAYINACKLNSIATSVALI